MHLDRLRRATCSRSFRRILAIACLVVAVVVAGNWGWRTAQSSYYEGLYQQNHTGQRATESLYGCGAPLGTDQSWQVSKDGGKQYERVTFPGNVPVLSGGVSGQPMLGLIPYSYGDVEVDDWIFQYGHAAQDGTGLVLHANPTTGDMFVFSVSKRTHAWRFSRHLHGVWTDLQSSTQSDLINRGPSWDNLLSVIMRGDQYILFINYHFVGVFTDSALPAGHMGIYAADGTITGNFTCPTVYRTV